MTQEKSPFRIGVDLGGTKTEVILLAPDGRELFRKRRPTPRDDGYDAILENIRILVDEARSEISSFASGATSYTLGMGIPGAMNEKTGLVMNANTTVLIGHPLASDLQRLLNHPITIENDANCFALAEAKAGAAVSYSTVFGIIMGTGCGSGIVMNGSVWHGSHGIAGEFGHFSIQADGPLCWCGHNGCIEMYLSGTGVSAHHKERTGQSLTMEEIVTGFHNGDQECKLSMEKLFEDFGRAVGGIISLLDPHAIVIGGGLSQIDELYTLGAESAYRHAFHPDLRTPILKNSLGDSAGVIGAAWIGI